MPKTQIHAAVRCPTLAVALGVVATALPTAAAPQSASPLIGRWDLVVDVPGPHRAGWLEVRPSGRSALVGAVVLMVGSARPISRIDETNGAFRFTIPTQWEDAPGENTVAGRVRGDSLSGTLTLADGRTRPFVGVRAPALVRTAPPTWELPVTLFNGRDLSGWTAIGDGASHWSAVDGVLRNAAAGQNLVTERTFTDFRLHVEFRYPKAGNAGIYLRGRYEVQVEDTPGIHPTLHGIGAVYGHLIPNEHAALGPDRWNSYDITLIGRRVTVVLNGKTVIADQVIPGITGGALDSDEGRPGPIYLQGDHGPVEFRNIVITPAR